MKRLMAMALVCGSAFALEAGWKLEEKIVSEDYETKKAREGGPEVFSGLIAPGLLVQTKMAKYRTDSSVVIERTPASLRLPEDGSKALARSFRIYSFKEAVLETTFRFGSDSPYRFQVKRSGNAANLVCVCEAKQLEVPVKSLPAEFLFTANREGEAELSVKGLGDSSVYSMRFLASRFQWSSTRPVSVETELRSEGKGAVAEIVLDELMSGYAVAEKRFDFPVVMEPAATFDPAKAGWRKVFEDEFDGDRLDTSKWFIRDGHPELVKVGGGELRIGCDFKPGCTEHVSSNLCTTTLRSQTAYRFGYYEARVKFTRQNGWWAAFWLYGIKNADPFTEGFEIDIFEDFYTRRRDPSGKLYNTIDHNLHMYCGSMQALKSWNYNSEIPGTLDEWYDVGCKWTPFEISYYINGRLVKSHAWHSPWNSVTFDAFSHGCGTAPLHMMVSGEIMRSQWNSDTQDISGCTFPDWYHVDRVRVWEYPLTGDRAPTVEWAAGSQPSGKAKPGTKLVFRAKAAKAKATGAKLKAVYLFDTGYPLQCVTRAPLEFTVPFDETYYRTTRYMEPGRQNRPPSFDVPHTFQLFVQDTDGAVGFSEPLVIYYADEVK